MVSDSRCKPPSASIRWVVQQAIDGGGGQRLGHDRVKPGVQVRPHHHRATFVGGVDHPVKRLGRVRSRRESDLEGRQGASALQVGSLRSTTHPRQFLDASCRFEFTDSLFWPTAVTLNTWWEPAKPPASYLLETSRVLGPGLIGTAFKSPKMVS